MKYKFKLKEIVMEATGFFIESYPYSKEGHWNINYSGILSDLICKAGRYCQHYASDLFIDWKGIESCLDNADYKGGTYLFGFRRNGVDHDTFINSTLEQAGGPETVWSHYYEIMMLTIETDRETNSITMKYGPAVLVKEGEGK